MWRVVLDQHMAVHAFHLGIFIAEVLAAGNPFVKTLLAPESAENDETKPVVCKVDVPNLWILTRRTLDKVSGLRFRDPAWTEAPQTLCRAKIQLIHIRFPCKMSMLKIKPA